MNPFLPLIHKMLGHAIGLFTAGGAVAAVDFRNQVTLGSVIVAGIVLVVAGLFTIRSKIASVWREEAEGEKAKASRLEEELEAERASRVEYEKEQTEIRHELRAEIADLGAQLKVMEARTDLSAAIDAIRDVNATVVGAVTASVSESLRGSRDRDDRMYALLEEIRDRLPPKPTLEGGTTP